MTTVTRPITSSPHTHEIHEIHESVFARLRAEVPACRNEELGVLPHSPRH
jgi:hypothetical protein